MENVEIYASASGSGRHMAHMAHMTSAVWPSHCRGQLQLGREGTSCTQWHQWDTPSECSGPELIWIMGGWSSKTRLSAEDMQFLQTKTQLDQASIEVATTKFWNKREETMLTMTVRNLLFRVDWMNWNCKRAKDLSVYPTTLILCSELVRGVPCRLPIRGADQGPVLRDVRQDLPQRQCRQLQPEYLQNIWHKQQRHNRLQVNWNSDGEHASFVNSLLLPETV